MYSQCLDCPLEFSATLPSYEVQCEDDLPASCADYLSDNGIVSLTGVNGDGVTSLDQAQESSSTSSPGGSGVPVPDPGDTLVPKLYSWSIRSINIVLISIRTEVSLVNANVTIRSGEGIGGTALYTGVWTFSSVTAANTWITYDLTGGPSYW